MIALRFKTLLSQSFKNPLIYHPNNSFTYSLLFSSQTQKAPETSNAISDYFVQQHQFSPQVATKAASALTHLKTPAKCDAVLSFFKGIGFSKMDLQKTVDNNSGPKVLCASVDQTLKPKIKIFQDLNFSKEDIVCIVSDNPWLLLSSANNKILPSVLVLWNVLGSVDLVAKLLKVSAWFISYDLEKTLVPNIDFLKSCGIQLEQVARHIFNFPRFFLLRPETLKKFVERVDEMRFPRESKMYLYAITCVSSMSEVNFEKKLELFRSLGFTQDQIFQMFYKSPNAFAGSEEKIKEVMQVISASGLYDSSDVVKHPTVFGRSVERRLRPRLEVLKMLRNKKLISILPGFSVVYLGTDEKFTERFVTPYSRQLLMKGHSGNPLLEPSNCPMLKSPLCNQGLVRNFCSHASSYFDEGGPTGNCY